MPAIWLTIDFINQPKKPGGKYGSVKTREAAYVSVPVGDLGLFRKGGRYCCEIEETPEGYRNFIRFANTPPSQPATPPAPTNGYAAQRSVGGGYAPTQQRPAATQPAPQIRPAQAPPSNYYATPPDPQALSIFVTGIVGRALGSGHFLASDIDQLTKEARAAFLKHMAGIQTGPEQPQKQHYVDPELNDEVPTFVDDGLGEPVPF